ncbi:MAG: hypothetical protein EZS28_001637 [Streblomastix strix]|uniref:Uncharacterized protein n=1 Tax=Streblomastix strix TaxID=222440 RepID=A0A5J4X8I6_9EUKA|nr:MAG: hypothetical protein EZS28_001637 [Streblomastix strix]
MAEFSTAEFEITIIIIINIYLDWQKQIVDPLYRPVRVQLLVFWAEANAEIEHPFASELENMMQRMQDKVIEKQKKREQMEQIAKQLGFKLDDDVLADEINQQFGRMTAKTKSKKKQKKYKELFSILDSIEKDNQKRLKKLKNKRERERMIRYALRSKRLPQRLIVRARTTDVKGEMMQTNPATFNVQSNREDAGILERVSDRGAQYGHR